MSDTRIEDLAAFARHYKQFYFKRNYLDETGMCPPMLAAHKEGVGWIIVISNGEVDELFHAAGMLREGAGVEHIGIILDARFKGFTSQEKFEEHERNYERGDHAKAAAAGDTTVIDAIMSLIIGESELLQHLQTYKPVLMDIEWGKGGVVTTLPDGDGGRVPEKLRQIMALSMFMHEYKISLGSRVSSTIEVIRVTLDLIVLKVPDIDVPYPVVMNWLKAAEGSYKP